MPPLGAFGAPAGVPAAAIWGTAAFGGSERRKNNSNFGRRERPGRGGSLAYAALGGDTKTEKKKSGASGAPFKGRLRRPKWF